MLLVGGGGPLGVSLQCLIERSGMVALNNDWTSNNLKSQVSSNECVNSFFFIC